MTNFWEEHPNAAQEQQWTSDPFIAATIYERISGGDSQGHWLDWLFSRHFSGRHFPRVLSVGCGVGDHEIAMASLLPESEIDAFDFSDASIAIAKSKLDQCGRKNVNFFTGNFNDIVIAESAYDLVLCSGSLHHCKELEHILEQVRGALRPEAAFVVNEYVGDCYNIYRDDQIAVIQNSLDGLPASLRRVDRFPNPSIEQVFARDPTEAVRAKLIPDFLRIYFKTVDERRLGGTLLHPLYPFIETGRLESDSDLHQSVMNGLIAVDELLLKSGKSDFSFFICSN